MNPVQALGVAVLAALAAGCASEAVPAPAVPAPAAPEETAAVPRGAEAAVAAFHREFPGGVLDEVARPRGFGAGSGDAAPLFWSMRFHSGDLRDEAPISPDGLLLGRKAALEPADLPPAVAAALAEEAPGAAPGRLVRHEMLTRLAFVGVETPERFWVATLETDGRASRILVRADGTVVKGGGGGEEDEGDGEGEADEDGEGEGAASPRTPAAKEIPIPAEAARAVAAVKRVWPDAVVEAVESVPVDDGTGHCDVLEYEVEFVFEGSMKQVLASPDGIVLRVDRRVERDALPPAVAAAVDRESAGGKVRALVAVEDRAALHFVGLPEPRVVYEAFLSGDGKPSSVRFTPEGRRIDALRPGGR